MQKRLGIAYHIPSGHDLSYVPPIDTALWHVGPAACKLYLAAVSHAEGTNLMAVGLICYVSLKSPMCSIEGNSDCVYAAR